MLGFSSLVTADGLTVSNLTSDLDIQPSIFRLIEGEIEFSSSSFSSLGMSVIESTSSPMHIQGTSFTSVNAHYGLVRAWNCPNIILDSLVISNMTSNSPLFLLQSSVITEFKDSEISTSNESPLTVRKSTIEKIQNITVTNANIGIVAEQSEIVEITDSTFEQ